MNPNWETDRRNGTGRPLGARNRLSGKLISDLAALWEAEGAKILQKMAMREPGQLARMAYATLPKDVLLSVEQRVPGGLSTEDWALLMEVLNLLRWVMPAGSKALPSETFKVIEDALRAHYAKQLPKAYTKSH